MNGLPCLVLHTHRPQGRLLPRREVGQPQLGALQALGNAHQGARATKKKSSQYLVSTPPSLRRSAVPVLLSYSTNATVRASAESRTH